MNLQSQRSPILPILVPAAIGILFGIGLSISEMVNPARVLGFLDIFGRWDPTLAFVMAGALAISIPSFQLVKRMDRPLLAIKFSLPDRKDIDRRLLGGSATFGIGWGLVGLCPGPAIVALSTFDSRVFIFVAALLAGFLAHKLLPE